MRCLVMIAVLAVGFCPAHAVDLRTIARMDLGVAKAPAGTSEVAFARQVGGRLHRYSSRTGLEACADLCQAPNGAWQAQMVSIGSHMSCSTTSQCGSRLVYRSLIHSHPLERQFVPNAVDLAVRKHKKGMDGVWHADDPMLFSAADYAIAGYLAVGGQLFHQKGVGTERALGMLHGEDTSLDHDP